MCISLKKKTYCNKTVIPGFLKNHLWAATCKHCRFCGEHWHVICYIVLI